MISSFHSMAQEETSNRKSLFQSKFSAALLYQDRPYACSVLLFCFHLAGTQIMVNSNFGKKLKLDTESSDWPLLVQPTFRTAWSTLYTQVFVAVWSRMHSLFNIICNIFHPSVLTNWIHIYPLHYLYGKWVFKIKFSKIQSIYLHTTYWKTFLEWLLHCLWYLC